MPSSKNSSSKPKPTAGQTFGKVVLYIVLSVMGGVVLWCIFITVGSFLLWVFSIFGVVNSTPGGSVDPLPLLTLLICIAIVAIFLILRELGHDVAKPFRRKRKRRRRAS